MKNIIIFGGAGFIGTHYKTYFQEYLPQINLFLFDLNTNSEVNFLNVKEPIHIEEQFTDQDVIINLAAIHKTPGHPDHEYFETNIIGAENVCDFAEKAGIKNIIFTSSIAPYGASENIKKETTLPTPNTPYGISKLVAEYIHKEWAAKDHSRKLLILRPGVVFGQGENGNFIRLASAISKGIFVYPGRKDTIKAAIYVKELVEQSWNLLNSQRQSVQTYNFAYYPSLTIESISLILSKVLSKKAPSAVIPASILGSIALILKISGLGKALGIHPERVRKLMISTNISGEKLYRKIEGKYKFTMEEAVKDWYKDCGEKGLF